MRHLSPSNTSWPSWAAAALAVAMAAVATFVIFGTILASAHCSGGVSDARTDSHVHQCPDCTYWFTAGGIKTHNDEFLCAGLSNITAMHPSCLPDSDVGARPRSTDTPAAAAGLRWDQGPIYADRCTPGRDDPATHTAQHACSKVVEAFLFENLSESKFNQLIRLVKEHDVPWSPSGSSWREILDRHQAEYCGEGFRRINISEEIGYTDGPLWLWVRCDVLADFIRHAGAPSSTGDNRFATNFSLLNNEDGVRVYNEFDSCNRWRDVEEAIGRTTATPSPKILWWVMWADKVNFSGNGRHVGHPITVSCANRTVEHQRTKRGAMLVGLIPTIPATQNYPKDSERLRLIRIQATQCSIKHAIGPFKERQWELHEVSDPSQKRQHEMYLRMGAGLGDTEEQWHLLGVKPNSEHPDIRTLVPNGSLDNLTLPFGARTELQHTEVMAAYNDLMSIAKTNGGRMIAARTKAAELLRALSIRPIELFLKGLANTNIYDMWPLDRLHQDANGISKYILELVVESLTPASLTRVNDYIRSLKSRGCPRLPTEGLLAVKMSAEERLALVKVMALATYGRVEDAVSDALALYARFQQLRDSPVHTDHSLDILSTYVTRWLRS
ncbi:MAG: hypothetical protein J3K34DRAFT_436322 [Monoraphidium minutum]|nr:MAG: hypothetical protein J3K34DRAFT_436322 [Monoraphidium minutum]